MEIMICNYFGLHILYVCKEYQADGQHGPTDGNFGFCRAPLTVLCRLILPKVLYVKVVGLHGGKPLLYAGAPSLFTLSI